MDGVILYLREKAVMTISESCHWLKIKKPYQGLGVERRTFEDREFN